MTGQAEFTYLRYPWGVSFTGMLLVTGPGGESVLIDTALPEAIDGFLLPQLAAAGVPAGSIRLVVNTHNHGDHAGGNARLRELCGAEFAIHWKGADALERNGFHPDLLFGDGTVLEAAGLRFEAVHAPGHSPDSCCILEPESGTLFTGDALQGLGTVYSGVALYADPDSYLRSVAKIEALFRRGRVRRILCGHACVPYGGDVPEQEIPAFLEICRETVLRYSRAVEAYLACCPQAGAAELGALLLGRFGVTRAPGLPGLERNTAGAHLAAFPGGATSLP
ncbi:MAG: MBL fold metallo-hydrolase [Lentisphaeria bacterium]|nr:MBL fold metallo-hydrolase [Lentisphaeria bacterium]